MSTRENIRLIARTPSFHEPACQKFIKCNQPIVLSQHFTRECLSIRSIKGT